MNRRQNLENGGTQFREILSEAAKREITKEEALYLFRETQGCDRTLKLFETAYEVRERELGNQIRLMGFVCCITRCTTDPACRYCFKWRNPDLFSPRDVLNEDELRAAARAIEGTGVRRVELAGGTLWGDEGSKATLKAIEAFTRASELDVWTNNGPSFAPADVVTLRESGAEGITCNLESISEEVYREMRPGDSLRARKEIVEATDRAGLGIDNTLMIGLGEGEGDEHPYQDWVEFLFYFKQFKNFRILEVGRFRPMPGSPVEEFPAGSSLEAAKARAIARLIFRDLDIAGAGDMLGLMAGANLAMHSVSVVHKWRMHPRGSAWGGNPDITEIGDHLVLVDYLPGISRLVGEFGMELE
ncbi:MAG: radical SAM protein [Chloroflexota bacterium]|nr:radical SAM protein [Chloroflexota bacterium]